MRFNPFEVLPRISRYIKEKQQSLQGDRIAQNREKTERNRTRYIRALGSRFLKAKVVLHDRPRKKSGKRGTVHTGSFPGLSINSQRRERMRRAARELETNYFIKQGNPAGLPIPSWLLKARS